MKRPVMKNGRIKFDLMCSTSISFVSNDMSMHIFCDDYMQSFAVLR